MIFSTKTQFVRYLLAPSYDAMSLVMGKNNYSYKEGQQEEKSKNIHPKSSNKQKWSKY